MTADRWIVLAIVLGAAFFLTRRAVLAARRARADKAGCNDCGCGH